FMRRAEICPMTLGIRFHDMRHTHATLLLEAGESVKYVAERLGDREDTIIETYAHVTPKMRSSAALKVRGFFGDGSLGVDLNVAMPRVKAETLEACDLPVTSL
ncbi:MAG: tyrosine-type recombinase/integrase, partial [Candidatus Dormibacteraceae bacterium]